MSKFLRLTILAIICTITTQAIAQYKNTISIQSTLKSISGDALPDGSKTIVFNLYSAPTGGSSLWDETASVQIVSGIYSHELGSVTDLNPSNFGQQLFLGVNVDGIELGPRTKLGYAPYAMSVSSLAASGQSAAFDGNGKFVVSKDMSVADVLTVANSMTVGGALSSGALTSGGISNTGNISNTGTVISNGLIQSTGAGIYGTIIKSSGQMACGGASTGPGTSLDLGVGHWQSGFTGDGSSLNFHAGLNTPKMTIIASNGHVGIGTTTPVTMLHVAGTAKEGDPDPHFTRFRQDDLLQNDAGNRDFIAYFDGFINTEGFFAGYSTTWSDNRIKTNLQQSNAKSDLALLNKIEITEYNLIDEDKDNRTQKKVIAQQVAEVLPNATTMTRMVIPNVYELAKDFEYKAGTLSVKTDKAHDFIVGDKIDLKTPKKDLDNIEVIAVLDEHTFSVKVKEKPENVFVYGKYVDDFLCVDYDAIAMLNVSASQEMYRMIMDLQKANKNLIKENNALKSSSASIEDRLSSLEAMMVKSENNTISNTDTAGK